MILESMLFLLTQISAIDQPQRMRELEGVYAVSTQRMELVEIETLKWPSSLEWLYYPLYLLNLTENTNTSSADHRHTDAGFWALSVGQ